MPSFREFPHCCTAKILVDFGESYTAEGGARKVTEKEMTEELENLFEECKYGLAQWAFICATTNNEQKIANRVLKKFGFERSRRLYKAQHAETYVYHWFLDCSIYLKDRKDRIANHKAYL